MCRISCVELRRIGHISRYLDKESVNKLVCSFIFSRIDYCNSLFYGLPKYFLDKLQRIQNHAARLVTKSNRFTPANCLLVDLHWLPIRYRIQYKIACLCYNFFNGSSPSYFSNLISVYSPPRNLRSLNQNSLSVPKKGSKTYGDRAFCHSAPETWNNFPNSFRNKVYQSESSFKNHLKTYLFNIFTSDDA